MATFSRRVFIAASASALLVPALAACSSGSGAQEFAEQLAQGLSKKDMSGIKLSQDVPTGADDFNRAVGYMKSATPTVSVESLAKADEGQKVTLKWSWKIPGSTQTFDYTTEAALLEEDGEWAYRWTPASIHPDLAKNQALRLDTSAATRGDITGAGGEKVVTLRPVVTLGIDKSKISAPAAQESSARALARLVEIDPDTYWSAVQAGGEQQFVQAITLRQHAFDALDQQALDAIEGYHGAIGELPLAPSSSFAPDILGGVGEATAEDIEASEGKLLGGETIGRGGLQGRFNELLAGSAGYTVSLVEIDETGAQTRQAALKSVVSSEPTHGTDLATTLDVKLQEKAVDLLKDQESPSALVALRLSTGELLAAANAEASEGFSTALLAQYAPGSIFKVASALALLRQGKTPESQVEITDSVNVDGVTFKNAPGYPASATGTQTLTTALAHSANTAFINERDTVSQANLQEASHGLGVGMTLDLGVDTFMGNVPDADTQALHAASLIGQGEVSVSPLSMAVLAASAAQGQIVTPVLVKGQDLADAQPAAGAAVTAAESKQLKTMMRAVVTEGSLGDLRQLTPDTAMGKTGTAEYGKETPPKTHSWVIAVHEDMAVALVVEDGDFGSVTGQPIVKAFLQD